MVRADRSCRVVLWADQRSRLHFTERCCPLDLQLDGPRLHALVCPFKLLEGFGKTFEIGDFVDETGRQKIGLVGAILALTANHLKLILSTSFTT